MNLNNSDFSEKEKITRTDIIYAVNINKSLANLDLSGVMLNEISLYSGDFKNAKMCGVDFYGTHIADTDFSGADLSYADNMKNNWLNHLIDIVIIVSIILILVTLIE
jgi:uncharacterized protein YjbI with pentapeptide repeats